MTIRYRRRTVTANDNPFPGYTKWQRHLRLQLERIVSPLRLLTVACMAIVWVSVGRVGAIPARDTAISGAAYALMLLVLLRAKPQWAARIHFVVPLLDFLLITLWVGITGGAQSPFGPLFFLGAAGAAILLSGGRGVGYAIAYAVADAVIARPAAMVEPFSIVIFGVGISIFSAFVQRDRISHLHDALTGSFNRAYGLFHLHDLLGARAFPFSVGLVDLDLFKQINDVHGHAAGDRALRECVRVLQENLREKDLLVRLGGDEFLLIWPDLDAQAAAQTADRLREAVSVLQVPVPNGNIGLTISMGVAQARRGMRPADLLSAADRSLYHAKQGRNRVALA